MGPLAPPRKASLLILGCGEGECGVCCRKIYKESRQLMFQRPELPDGSQGRILKGEGDGGGV